MESPDSSRSLKVTFNGPAEYWTDAIPIGNGRLGAMVWGGVSSELIQLNEDTLWTGTPSNYTNPNSPMALSEVRSLVDDGKYPEATAAAANLYGNHADAYQLLGDIKLEFDDIHSNYSKETYQRELDLDNAVARIKYAVGGTEYTREHFASYPHQVVVTKISGSKPGSVSFAVSLDSKLTHHSYTNEKSHIIMEGTCPGKRSPPDVNANDNPIGIKFSAILDVQISNCGGTIRVLDEKRLMIEHSDWAVLRLVALSSFDGPFTKPLDSKKDPTSEAQIALKSVKNISYADLYAHHIDDYQSLFHRVSLQLEKSCASFVLDEKKKPESCVSYLGLQKNQDRTVSTAERVKSFQNDEDPSLLELLFQFGRYLLISSSRPGTQVANLQGIWNKDLEPKWDSAPHLNINLEMNYWPSLPCNLSECHLPLFDFLNSLSVNGSKTAQVNYAASGWVVHNKSDIWAKPSADRGEVVWAIWPMGGAWPCTHLWEHYTYTLDKDFLKDKAYPLLEGCILFLLDWLIEGRGQYLETNPSTSPEHEFIAPDGKLASVSYSSTMDMAIIREVFYAFLAASEVLGRGGENLVEKVHNALQRLYPPKISRDGCIMEWAQDFEDPDVHHRHLSHLFGLFPGHTITVEDSPELCKAAERSLQKRGEDGPVWSTAWKTALWARLHDSDHAYRMVKRLINLVDPAHEKAFEGGLYSNLFAAHPPFQIDANFGFVASIAEMLVQSTMNDLYLLPALPRDKWANGCIRGLKARGGVTVNISWKEGDLNEVDLRSVNPSSGKRLHYRGATVIANLSPGTGYTFNGQLKCVNIFPL